MPLLMSGLLRLQAYLQVGRDSIQVIFLVICIPVLLICFTIPLLPQSLPQLLLYVLLPVCSMVSMSVLSGITTGLVHSVCNDRGVVKGHEQRGNCAHLWVPLSIILGLLLDVGLHELALGPLCPTLDDQGLLL